MGTFGWGRKWIEKNKWKEVTIWFKFNLFLVESNVCTVFSKSIKIEDLDQTQSLLGTGIYTFSHMGHVYIYPILHCFGLEPTFV